MSRRARIRSLLARRPRPFTARLLGPPAAAVIPVLVLLGAADARAQHLELTGFGGIAWGGSVTFANGNGSFDAGPIYGGSAYWRVRDDGLFGVIYSREESQFQTTVYPTTTGPPTTTLTDVIVNALHAGGELEISPQKRLTPTLGLSLGATWIEPTAGGATNWFFSAAVTGGGKYRLTDHMGLRAQMRLLVSVIGGNSSVVCVSAGGATCAVSANLDALLMGDLVAGVYVEF